MKKAVMTVLVALPAVALAELFGDIPNAKHAWAVHDWNRPKPSKVEVSANGIPSDAIVLFDGTEESMRKNWCTLTYDGEIVEPTWNCRDGALSTQDGPGLGALQTRAEFGDCQLHIEFMHPADTKTIHGHPQMRGNSGVFLMGSEYGYEIQVLESYYTSKELEGAPEYIENYADGLSGAVYAENPPMVNPQRKPGEWQTYDIVFHQPVWKDGKLVHPGSVTVLFNGVLVQDHWEMEGETTFRKRRPLAPHPTKGPLYLQDHACRVAYRNIWLRELPSRYDNVTNSEANADPVKVMTLRRETAARLFAKIADPKAATAENVKALAEVVSYANEGEYAAAFKSALEAYRAKKGDAKEIESLNDALKMLVRGGILAESELVR